MKKLFSQTLSELEITDANRQSQFVSRRTLIKGLGILTAACVLEPRKLFATPRYNYAVEAWLGLINDLVSSICDTSVAEQMQGLLSSADAYITPASNDFHQSFCAPFFLDLRIAPVATSYGQKFFEFDQYPFYDSERPCRRTKDVNEIELRRFLNRGEIEFYGGVVSPCSERREALQCEYDDFVSTAEHYETDPDTWEHLYTRNVTTGNKSYLAHAAKPRASRANGATPRKRALKQVFLSPHSL